MIVDQTGMCKAVRKRPLKLVTNVITLWSFLFSIVGGDLALLGPSGSSGQAWAAEVPAVPARAGSGGAGTAGVGKGARLSAARRTGKGRAGDADRGRLARRAG